MNSSEVVGEPPVKAKSQLAKQIVAVLFSVGLLFLAFRGANFVDILNYAKQIKPEYVLLTIVSSLASHVVRAWRWIYLLRPLAKKNISLFNSFAAVIIGYAVNIVIPRGGEVARLVSISKTEKLPWVGVLPTMLIDRLIDVAFLVMIFACSLMYMPDSLLVSFPWIKPGGISLAIGSVLGLISLPWAASIMRFITSRPFVEKRLPAKIKGRLAEIIEQFHQGTRSLTDMSTLPAIIVLSPLMWLFYFLNQYLMISAFGLQNQVSLSDNLVVFAIASIGVLIPSPGSVGSYHFFTSQALITQCHVSKEEALAFATVTHLLLFVFINAVPALICFLIQNRKSPQST